MGVHTEVSLLGMLYVEALYRGPKKTCKVSVEVIDCARLNEECKRRVGGSVRPRRQRKGLKPVIKDERGQRVSALRGRKTHKQVLIEVQ